MSKHTRLLLIDPTDGTVMVEAMLQNATVSFGQDGEVSVTGFSVKQDKQLFDNYKTKGE